MKHYTAPKHNLQVPNDGSALRDAAFCRMVIGVLMARLGAPTVVITQADMDTLAGLAVMEGRTPEGDFMLGLAVRKGASQ